MAGSSSVRVTGSLEAPQGSSGIRKWVIFRSGIREDGKFRSGIREKTKYRSGIRENQIICSGICENDFIRVFWFWNSGIRENRELGKIKKIVREFGNRPPPPWGASTLGMGGIVRG